jgi:hypothetical protein
MSKPQLWVQRFRFLGCFGFGVYFFLSLFRVYLPAGRQGVWNSRFIIKIEVGG